MNHARAVELGRRSARTRTGSEQVWIEATIAWATAGHDLDRLDEWISLADPAAMSPAVIHAAIHAQRPSTPIGPPVDPATATGNDRVAYNAARTLVWALTIAASTITLVLAYRAVRWAFG
ncbi:MAG: hypothetical protein ABR616_07745 [Dermatophilaceae bacterium]